MTKGITVAGTIIADHIKIIDRYPDKGMLSNITKVSSSVGGCVPNTAITMAKLGGVKVSAAGRIGADASGEFVTSCMSAAGVDISGVKITPDIETSFTDVMTEAESGERTFFNTRGANALLTPADLKDIDTDILHIGYLLLLDGLDKPDSEFGTVMARVLHNAQARGIKTSIDAVSSSGGGFLQIVPPALRYCDYAVVNELEGGLVTGIAPRDTSGALIEDNIIKILQGMTDLGAKRAIIHSPEGGFCLYNGKYTAVPSLLLPKGYIKGAVGAGDAFAAGVLYAYYNGADDRQALELGSCTAAANLAAADSVSGALSYADTVMLKDRFGQRKNFTDKV